MGNGGNVKSLAKATLIQLMIIPAHLRKQLLLFLKEFVFGLQNGQGGYDSREKKLESQWRAKNTCSCQQRERQPTFVCAMICSLRASVYASAEATFSLVSSTVFKAWSRSWVNSCTRWRISSAMASELCTCFSRSCRASCTGRRCGKEETTTSVPQSGGKRGDPVRTADHASIRHPQAFASLREASSSCFICSSARSACTCNCFSLDLQRRFREGKRTQEVFQTILEL